MTFIKVPQRVRHVLLNTPVVWSVWSIAVHLLFQVFKDILCLVLELRLHSDFPGAELPQGIAHMDTEVFKTLL